MAATTIPPNSLITVVGISGYIASYAGLAALQAGYRVRGTVRSLQRGQAIRDAYAKLGVQDIDKRLEFVVVNDLSSVEQFRRAFEGAAGVINPAINLEKFTEVVFVDLAIESARNMLQAAKLVPSVKRVVMTSSIVSVIFPGTYSDKTITDGVWNNGSEKEMAKEVAAGQTPHPMVIYPTAKVKSEQAAWEFMEKEKPHFDLVTVLPGTCIGPVLHGKPPSTAEWFADLFKNDPSLAIEMGVLHQHIDIRDCGTIHLKSLTDPSVGGQRVLCVSQPFGWNEVLAIMRKNFPNVKTISADLDNKVGYKWVQNIDNSRAKEMVGDFIGVEKSIVDFGKSQGY